MRKNFFGFPFPCATKTPELPCAIDPTNTHHTSPTPNMENRASVVIPKTVHVVPLALSTLSLVVGVASIIVAGVALNSSWTAGDEDPLGLSNMIAGPTGFMAWVTAWEYGPESKWRSICSNDITFSIPALGVSYSGKDSLWGFRKYLSGGTFGQLCVLMSGGLSSFFEPRLISRGFFFCLEALLASCAFSYLGGSHNFSSHVCSHVAFFFVLAGHGPTRTGATFRTKPIPAFFTRQ